MKSRLKCHPEKYVQQNPPESGADPLASVPNPLLQGQDEQPRAQDFEPIAASDNQVWSLTYFLFFIHNVVVSLITTLQLPGTD